MEIKLFRQTFTLKNLFRIAHGAYSYRESIFVWLREGQNIGIGEAPIVPYYGISADKIEKDLANGLSLTGVKTALRNPHASLEYFKYSVSRSAFQSAILQLYRRQGGQLPGLPSERTIRGNTIPATSFTIGYDEDPEAMVRVAKSSGFRRLKVKAGIAGDIERIALLRERLPEAIIRVDANQGWTKAEAPEKISALEGLGVELIEEPVAGAPEDFEALAAGTTVPILVDESVRDRQSLDNFLCGAPSVAGIVVKTAKNGGPIESASLMSAAIEGGMRVMVSCMVESSLGIGAALSFASACSWCDLDAPLLIVNDPFEGLSYEDETPRLSNAGISPGPVLTSYIENLSPLWRD